MTTSEPKRLTKGKEKKWMGVCSGIADYFNVDPVLVRVTWILITVFTSLVPGIIVYVMAAWVMPENEEII